MNTNQKNTTSTNSTISEFEKALQHLSLAAKAQALQSAEEAQKSRKPFDIAKASLDIIDSTWYHLSLKEITKILGGLEDLLTIGSEHAHFRHEKGERLDKDEDDCGEKECDHQKDEEDHRKDERICNCSAQGDYHFQAVEVGEDEQKAIQSAHESLLQGDLDGLLCFTSHRLGNARIYIHILSQEAKNDEARELLANACDYWRAIKTAGEEIQKTIELYGKDVRVSDVGFNPAMLDALTFHPVCSCHIGSVKGVEQ